MHQQLSTRPAGTQSACAATGAARATTAAGARATPHTRPSLASARARAAAPQILYRVSLALLQLHMRLLLEKDNAGARAHARSFYAPGLRDRPPLHLALCTCAMRWRAKPSRALRR